MNCNVLYSASVDCLKNKSLFLRAYDIVSDSRKKKTDAFYFEKDKFLSLGAEMLLRKVLHHEGNLELSYSPEGKPFLKNSPRKFNLSHSEHYVLCALSDTEVGCDIEKTGKADYKLADAFFSEEDNYFIRSSDEPDRAFFRIWTIRESYAKAIGTGISEELKNAEIDFETHRINNTHYFKEFNDIPEYCICLCCGKEISQVPLVITELFDEESGFCLN